MSNNGKIELLKNKIEQIEIKIKNEQDPAVKASYIEQEIALRKKYTPLLLKKRPLLLSLGIIFAIFYGISLMICLPPFIIRGKKRDINEDKILKLRAELAILKKQIGKSEEKMEEKELTPQEEIAMLRKELEELKKSKTTL